MEVWGMVLCKYERLNNGSMGECIWNLDVWGNGSMKYGCQ